MTNGNPNPLISDNDIVDCMSALSAKNRIFCSEADLKAAFAWEMCEHKRNSGVNIHARFEYLPWKHRKDIRIDLVFFDDQMQEIVPMEFKYKTDELHVSINNEEIFLRAQQRHTQSAKNFYDDVKRMRIMLHSNKYTMSAAYVIFLTNDYHYISPQYTAQYWHTSLKKPYRKNALCTEESTWRQYIQNTASGTAGYTFMYVVIPAI